MKRTIFTLLFLMLGIFTVMSVDNDVGLQGEEQSYNIVDVESLELNAVIGLEEAIMQADQEVSLIPYFSVAKAREKLTIKNGDGINTISEDLVDPNVNFRTILRLDASAIPNDVIIKLKGEVLTDFSTRVLFM